MEINFIDQDDAVAVKWILLRRIGYCHSAGQVSDHRKSTFLSIGELVYKQYLLLLEHYHTKRISRDPETGESRKKPLDCQSYCAQLAITIAQLIQALFVLHIFTISEPLKKRAEVPAIS